MSRGEQFRSTVTGRSRDEILRVARDQGAVWFNVTVDDLDVDLDSPHPRVLNPDGGVLFYESDVTVTVKSGVIRSTGFAATH